MAAGSYKLPTPNTAQEVSHCPSPADRCYTLYNVHSPSILFPFETNKQGTKFKLTGKRLANEIAVLNQLLPEYYQPPGKVRAYLIMLDLSLEHYHKSSGDTLDIIGLVHGTMS